MERKRLRVDGIPTDIPAGRARDKLTIHFLRSRNGGGEVENIDIIQGNPTYAIVTFEDDGVVEGVLKIKDHLLRVNDKIYNLAVSEVTGKLELEEVFQKLSLTVNYKKFPQSCRSFLKNLPQTHKDVKLDIDEKSMTCIIGGPYAVIQTLAQDILSKLEIGGTKEISSDTRRKTKSERLKDHSDPQDIPQVLDQRSAPVYGSAKEEKYLQKTESLEQLQEPFVWDSDIFKYIQKFHSLEFQEIQEKYYVLAVDEGSEEITTIYLQTLNGGKNPLADLRAARSRLTGLYQGLELLLRKEQIDKREVYGDQDFHRLLIRDLQKLYPMLLCHDDDRFLYLIGNGVDVAHGKQYISDLNLKLARPSSYLDTQFKASGTSSMSEGGSYSLSPTYRHESRVGSRIAASFNMPTTLSSLSPKGHIDERYLVSNSPSKLGDPPNDRTSLIPAMTSDLYKNEEFSLSQPDEKSESKTMPSLKRRDVLPALKTGREDLRPSRATSKPSGPMKPVQFTKASSELPYSSLVDVNLPSADFKLPEGRLRRSNSLSRVYSKESAPSDQQSDPLIFKDEVVVTDQLWHYIKQVHKSDIDSWCSELVLTEEEKQSGKLTLQLKATNKSVLTLAKERIQLLCWKEDISVASSCLEYAALGVQGPDDIALVEWCDLFRKCSKKLCVKLEKDKLVLLYPKEIQERVLEECSQHLERKTRDETTTDDAQSSHPRDKLEFSGSNMAEDYLTDLKNSTSHLQPFYLGDEETSQTNNSRAGKGQGDLKYSPVGGTDPFQGITHKTKTFFDNPVPASLDDNSARLQGRQDFFEDPKNSSASEKFQMDFYASRKPLENVLTDVRTYDHSSYSSEITQGSNYSPTNVQNQTHLEPYGDQGTATEVHSSSISRLRVPAVGQESGIMDSICVQCGTSDKTIKTSSGQNLCVNCYTKSYKSALKDTANGKAIIRASMTHTSMSLQLPGHEKYTSLKIIYEVSGGVQGAEDPQPGCQYQGGRFEAYLPDNREGKKLLSLLTKALDAGLIFHIKSFETGEKVTWYKIPHKTSPDGGKPKNGYPDLSYIKATIALLKEYGIE